MAIRALLRSAFPSWLVKLRGGQGVCQAMFCSQMTEKSSTDTEKPDPTSTATGMDNPTSSDNGMADPTSSDTGMADPTSTDTGMADPTSADTGMADPTVARVKKFASLCNTPKDACTNLLNFLTESDVNKRNQNINIPFFTGGCHVAVTYADRASPTGLNKFVGICIARRNKGLGTTFILRNVIGHVPVERMFELYSPHIKKIEILRLERRRRAKLYYLRDKPPKYSTVDWNAEPDTSDTMRKYKRKKGAPA